MHQKPDEKKKLLIFIPEFPRLSETFIQREIVKLVERDILDVTVLSLKKGDGELSGTLSKSVRYQRLSITKSLAAIPYFFSKTVSMSRVFSLLKARDCGFISRIFLFLKSVGYVKVFEEFKPDFIWAHFMSKPSTLAMCSAEIMGIPFGISAHARDVTVEADCVKPKIEKAKFILICNRNAFQKLIDLNDGRRASNVYLQYHGIDFNQLQDLATHAFREIKEKPDRPVVSAVGTRLVEKKGHKYLIEASKILKERGFSHYLYLGGPGPLYKDLQKQIMDLDLQDIVKIIGEGQGLPFKEVVKYYTLTSVYAFAGVRTEDGDEDGLPNVLAESAILRVPVVATDVGSTMDLIQDETSGLVVSQRDPRELADALERMIFDSNLRERVVEGAYDRVKKIFDLDKNVEIIEKLIIGTL